MRSQILKSKKWVILFFYFNDTQKLYFINSSSGLHSVSFVSFFVNSLRVKKWQSVTVKCLISNTMTY